MSTWWRRNRWALLALPFLLVLAVAASSYRVITTWQPWQLTDPVEAGPGQPARLVDEGIDLDGSTYPIDVLLSSGTLRQATRATDSYGDVQELPEIPGTVVWRVELAVSADPETKLTGCRLRLVDEKGRETTYSSVRPGISLPSDPCVPRLDVDIFADEDEPPPPRPESYTRPIYFRTTDDFVPVRMDVYWDTPTYAALELPDPVPPAQEEG